MAPLWYYEIGCISIKWSIENDICPKGAKEFTDDPSIICQHSTSHKSKISPLPGTLELSEWKHLCGFTPLLSLNHRNSIMKAVMGFMCVVTCIVPTFCNNKNIVRENFPFGILEYMFLQGGKIMPGMEKLKDRVQSFLLLFANKVFW